MQETFLGGGRHQGLRCGKQDRLPQLSIPLAEGKFPTLEALQGEALIQEVMGGSP